MRRSYRSKRFLGILDKVRERIPHAAVTTDIIVGFPGETEDDFQQTLDVVQASRFSMAYTFQYSPREGTPAAEMEDQIPKEVVQERFERLVALQDRIAAEESAKLVGTRQELLVTNDSGARDDKTGRLTGRAPDNRLVHFSMPDGVERPRPGDFVTVPITESHSYHLIADPNAAEQYVLRRSRAGDAWDRAQAESCGTSTGAPANGVNLGLPSLRVGAN